MTETNLDAAGSLPRSLLTAAHGPRARIRCLHGGHALLVAAALAGCSYPPLPNPIVGGPPGDGAAVDSAGPPPRSPLLLSEVVLAPPGVAMIEIVNTSNQSVDLSTYYLSDSGKYFQLPIGASLDGNDFIAKFPDHAVIPGHGVATVALPAPPQFKGIYGMFPTFSFADGTMQVIASSTPVLNSSGEPIILFQWDGQSDLVTDVDIMIVGAPTAAHLLINKSGMSQDGPDTDNRASTYASDAGTLQPQAAAPMTNTTTTPIQVFSTQRILLEDGHEHPGGTGNGQNGDDETSEDTSMTWDGTTAHPFGLATPGQVPAVLLR